MEKITITQLPRAREDRRKLKIAYKIIPDRRKKQRRQKTVSN